jgi:uncharacterized protein (TIGR03067 family)
MKRRVLGLIAFFGAVGAGSFTEAAPGLKDPPKDPPGLVGTWEVATFRANGREKPQAVTYEWQFTADGHWLIRTDGKNRPGESRYSADPKADSPTIDFDAGPGTSPRRGIYRVDGDTLTVCIGSSGPNRPTGFDAPAGSPNFLYTFKRVRKD